ncbi:MAG TPA: tellurite resistance TerB family protein [Candidatus Sulfotelmatobacter sp.]|jgi:tellurite resistance protein|nr:tellurite resistance TerB family protein [Candidatus Sulfotelmatobacter sp.]
MISHHAALIYTMVLVSAADSDMSDAEIRAIGEMVRYLPVFQDYQPETLPATAEACAEMLEMEDGLEKILELVRQSLPAKLRETAYALACDVAVADAEMNQEKLRVLELIRHKLEIDRLVSAAIERGARARYRRA